MIAIAVGSCCPAMLSNSQSRFLPLLQVETAESYLPTQSETKPPSPTPPCQPQHAVQPHSPNHTPNLSQTHQATPAQMPPRTHTRAEVHARKAESRDAAADDKPTSDQDCGLAHGHVVHVVQPQPCIITDSMLAVATELQRGDTVSSGGGTPPSPHTFQPSQQALAAPCDLALPDLEENLPQPFSPLDSPLQQLCEHHDDTGLAKQKLPLQQQESQQDAPLRELSHTQQSSAAEQCRGQEQPEDALQQQQHMQTQQMQTQQGVGQQQQQTQPEPPPQPFSRVNVESLRRRILQLQEVSTSDSPSPHRIPRKPLTQLPANTNSHPSSRSISEPHQSSTAVPTKAPQAPQAASGYGCPIAPNQLVTTNPLFKLNSRPNLPIGPNLLVIHDSSVPTAPVSCKPGETHTGKDVNHSTATSIAPAVSAPLCTTRMAGIEEETGVVQAYSRCSSGSSSSSTIGDILCSPSTVAMATSGPLASYSVSVDFQRQLELPSLLSGYPGLRSMAAAAATAAAAQLHVDPTSPTSCSSGSSSSSAASHREHPDMSSIPRALAPDGVERELQNAHQRSLPLLQPQLPPPLLPMLLIPPRDAEDGFCNLGSTRPGAAAATPVRPDPRTSIAPSSPPPDAHPASTHPSSARDVTPDSAGLVPNAVPAEMSFQARPRYNVSEGGLDDSSSTGGSSTSGSCSPTALCQGGASAAEGADLEDESAEGVDLGGEEGSGSS